MKLKISANISWLFKESDNLLVRYKSARDAGFEAVESRDLSDIPLEDVVAAKAGACVTQVLMNAWPGDIAKGEAGIAAIPGREQAFRESIDTSIKYCNALQCPRLHIMAGDITGEHSEQAMRAVYVDNLRYAADILDKHGITALIEPVNSRISRPGYFMDNVDKAMSIIKEVDHPNLKLQMDLFHVQVMHGNLTGMIRNCVPYIGHIQIAQAPHRHEPDSPGEINYQYIFKLLEELEYDGFVGLEYAPAGKTEDGLAWIKSYMAQ